MDLLVLSVTFLKKLSITANKDAMKEANVVDKLRGSSRGRTCCSSSPFVCS